MVSQLSSKTKKTHDLYNQDRYTPEKELESGCDAKLDNKLDNEADRIHEEFKMKKLQNDATKGKCKNS